MRSSRSMALTTALVLAVSPALVTAAPSAVPTAPAATREAPRVPVPGEADAASYAEREARDADAAAFEGGNVVIVSISGGALVVLLFLLLLF